MLVAALCFAGVADCCLAVSGAVDIGRRCSSCPCMCTPWVALWLLILAIWFKYCRDAKASPRSQPRRQGPGPDTSRPVGVLACTVEQEQVQCTRTAHGACSSFMTPRGHSRGSKSPVFPPGCAPHPALILVLARHTTLQGDAPLRGRRAQGQQGSRPARTLPSPHQAGADRHHS